MSGTAVTTRDPRLHDKLAKPWAPGQSGNPAGRPTGARQRLSEAFITALAKDFAANGTSTIERVRTDYPDKYLTIAASFVPKEVSLTDAEGGPLQIVIRRMGDEG